MKVLRAACARRRRPAIASRWWPDMRLEALREELVRLHARAAAQRPRRLDRRQRQRPRPGDGPRGDQAVGRPLRGPDGRVDGRARPRRRGRRGRVPSVVGHGEPPVHLPPSPRRQRRRAHPLALRDGVRGRRPADPGLPDGPGRRVRRRDPVRRLRPRSATRPSATLVVEGIGRSPGDPAQAPRRVHGRPDGGGRGQGRGHGRGRRRHGLGGPPDRDARGPPRRRRRAAPRPLHDGATANEPRRRGVVRHASTSGPTRSGSSPAASTCTDRRRSRPSRRTPPRSPRRSTPRRRSRSASWPSRS